MSQEAKPPPECIVISAAECKHKILDQTTVRRTFVTSKYDQYAKEKYHLLFKLKSNPHKIADGTRLLNLLKNTYAKDQALMSLICVMLSEAYAAMQDTWKAACYLREAIRHDKDVPVTYANLPRIIQSPPIRNAFGKFDEEWAAVGKKTGLAKNEQILFIISPMSRPGAVIQEGLSFFNGTLPPDNCVIEVVYSERLQGFDIVAKQNISKGQIIFQETPHLAATVDACRCHHCVGALTVSGIVECRLNCGFKYCSTLCESQAWNGYHKPLCECGSVKPYRKSLETEFSCATFSALRLASSFSMTDPVINPLIVNTTATASKTVPSNKLSKKLDEITPSGVSTSADGSCCQSVNTVTSRPTSVPLTASDLAFPEADSAFCACCRSVSIKGMLTYKLIGVGLQTQMNVWTQSPYCFLASMQSVQAAAADYHHKPIFQCDLKNLQREMRECFDSIEYGSKMNENHKPRVIRSLDLDWLLRVRGFVDLNEVPIGSASDEKSTLGGPGVALGRIASLFNHSCANAEQVVVCDSVPGPLQIKYFARRNIKKGASVRISYCKSGMDFRARKQELLKGYGFRCTCRDCLGEVWKQAASIS